MILHKQKWFTDLSFLWFPDKKQSMDIRFFLLNHEKKKMLCMSKKCIYLIIKNIMSIKISIYRTDIFRYNQKMSHFWSERGHTIIVHVVHDQPGPWTLMLHTDRDNVLVYNYNVPICLELNCVSGLDGHSYMWLRSVFLLIKSQKYRHWSCSPVEY